MRGFGIKSFLSNPSFLVASPLFEIFKPMMQHIIAARVPRFSRTHHISKSQ